MTTPLFTITWSPGNGNFRNQKQGRNHAVKVGGSGWATDGARVDEGMGTVSVAAPGFSNEGWGAADHVKSWGSVQILGRS